MLSAFARNLVNVSVLLCTHTCTRALEVDFEQFCVIPTAFAGFVIQKNCCPCSQGFYISSLTMNSLCEKDIFTKFSGAGCLSAFV